MRSNLFTLAPWLPLIFYHSHWDQTEESLCPSLGSRPILAQGPSAHVPLLFGTTLRYLSFQPPRLPPSEDASKHTFSTWPPPVDIGVPNGLFMLRNSLSDFVFEHRYGCCATEPGYAGDIAAIEFDWLIDFQDFVNIGRPTKIHPFTKLELWFMLTRDDHDRAVVVGVKVFHYCTGLTRFKSWNSFKFMQFRNSTKSCTLFW